MSSPTKPKKHLITILGLSITEAFQLSHLLGGPKAAPRPEHHPRVAASSASAVRAPAAAAAESSG